MGVAMTIEDTILTKKKFSAIIETTVLAHKLSYMDAIIHVCEERELDPGEVGKLISPVIKDKLEAECIELRLIEGTTTKLPV
jgi:hypothetical protein